MLSLLQLASACVSFSGQFPLLLEELQLNESRFEPYSAIAPLYTDHLSKARSICVPEGTSVKWKSDQEFEFPVGTVILKKIDQVETRVSIQTSEGWVRVGYRKIQSGSPVRVDRDTRETLPGHRYPWTYPGPQSCKLCHTPGQSLGFAPQQVPVADLRRLIELRVIEPRSGDLQNLAQLPDYMDAQLPVETRAKSYLQANCAHCHYPGSRFPFRIDLRYETPVSEMGVVDIEPSVSDLSIPNAMLIARGEPDRSVLLQRMKRTDHFRMPKIGSAEPDEAGAGLIADWIKSMPTKK